MTDKHYTHIFEAFEGKPFVPMARLVDDARQRAGVSSECPNGRVERTQKTSQAAKTAA